MTKVKVANRKLESRSGASQTSGFRAGARCQSPMEVKRGDLVFIDSENDPMISHRLGFTRLTGEELSRLPMRVLRVEPINGRIIIEAPRTDGVGFDQVRRAIPIPLSA